MSNLHRIKYADILQVVHKFGRNPETPLGPYPAGTDLFWLAKVSATTGEVDIDFEILLV